MPAAVIVQRGTLRPREKKGQPLDAEPVTVKPRLDPGRAASGCTSPPGLPRGPGSGQRARCPHVLQCVCVFGPSALGIRQVCRLYLLQPLRRAAGEAWRPGAPRPPAEGDRGACKGSRVITAATLTAAEPITLIKVRTGKLSLSEVKSLAHVRTARQEAEMGLEPRSVRLRELWGEWLEGWSRGAMLGGSTSPSSTPRPPAPAPAGHPHADCHELPGTHFLMPFLT